MNMSLRVFLTLVACSVLALSGYYYWKLRCVDLVVVVESAPMYALERGEYSYVDKKNEIARIPRGTVIRAVSTHDTKDYIIYRAQYDGKQGYVILGDVQPK